MERKDWLIVALQLIIIVMLITSMLAYNLNEQKVAEKLKDKEAREQALEQCKVIIDAKNLLDEPLFWETSDPDTIEFYQTLAQLYPKIIEPYRVFSNEGRAKFSILCGTRGFGPEGYANILAEDLAKGEI